MRGGSRRTIETLCGLPLRFSSVSLDALRFDQSLLTSAATLLGLVALLCSASVSVAQQVPAPQYFPPDGTLVPTSVTLTCADPTAAIYFTRDGTAPDTNAFPYTAPLPLTNVTTLRARAFKTDLAPSDVVTANYYEPYLVTTFWKNVTNNATASPSVSLLVRPVEAVLSYAVEESVPAGLDLAEVNLGGVWNPTNQTLRWGPFQDSSARLFIYQVSGIAGSHEVVSRISLNGISIPEGEYNARAAVEIAGPPPPVATPVFDPPGGASAPVSVRISCTTSNAHIFFTRDGGVPDTNATLYTAEIVVTNETTLRVQAFAEGLEPSEEAFATYFDPAWAQTAPVRTITNNASCAPEVHLAVAPATGVRSYGLSEQLPPLLVPTAISHGGDWLATNRMVCWGPFQDDTPRGLSYQVTGPEGDFTLEGVASFDGRSRLVTGENTVRVREVLAQVESPVFVPPDGALVPVAVAIWPSPRTFSRRVTSSADDAEEGAAGPGRMSLTSSTLELVKDGSAVQTVGVRFTGVDVPKDALLLEAYVQFTQAENKNEDPFSVSVRAEAADAAPAFSTNSLDVSSRTGTVAAVSWSGVAAWTNYHEAGPSQRTLDLTPLVREVMNLPGWVSGNPLAFVFSGQGCRTAVAYDGGAALAPELVIRYAASGVNLYYTSDGTVPDTNATLYAGPIPLTNATTLRARAFQAGLLPSEPVAASYHEPAAVWAELSRAVTNNGTFEPEVNIRVIPVPEVRSYGVEEELPPTLTPFAISHSGTWNETNRTIKWSPFQDNLQRSLSYRVGGPEGTHEIEGVGSFNGHSQGVTGATQVVLAGVGGQVAMPVLSPENAVGLPVAVTLNCATPGATIYFTMDSTVPGSGAQLYSGPVTLTNFAVLRARAFRPGMSPSDTVVGVYQGGLPMLGGVVRTVLNATSPTPAVNLSVTSTADVLSHGVEERLAGLLLPEGISHGGVWTETNRTIKWGPFQDYTPRVLTYTVRGPDGLYPVEGTASFNGWGFAVAGEATLAVAGGQVPVTTPEFSPPEGTPVPVAVNITCATPGAQIFYTTDTSVPTMASTPYAGPVLVSLPTTLRARAFKAGLVPSDTAAADYPAAGTAASIVRSVIGSPLVVQRVELAVQPAPGVRSQAVEESVPLFLTPEAVSHGGVWWELSRTVRWGPFADAAPRTLSYTVAGMDGEYWLEGTGSFDGRSVRVGGDEQVTINFPPPTNLLAVAGNRAVYLKWPRVTGAAGYRVHFWPDGGADHSLTVDAGNPASDYFPVEGLTNNTLYFFALTAYDGQGYESRRTETVSAVPAEGAGSLGQVWFDRAAYDPTAHVAVISLRDANANTDAGSAESVTVRVRSYSDAVGFELTLREVGLNTNLFTSQAAGTNLGFTFGDSDPTNKLIRVVEGDALFATYHDVLPPVDTTAYSRVDGLPPVTTLVASWPFRTENGTNFASSVCSYSLAAADASGVSRIEYSVDGVPVVEFVSPFFVSALGPHTVAFRSQDRAGHWETWQVVSFIVEDDYDHDGMLDAWEILHFGDLTAADARSDRDGDGARDVEEFIAGTHPNNRLDYLHITVCLISQAPGGNLVLRWNSVVARFYTLLSATNLTEAAWGTVLQRPGDGATQSFTNTLPDVGQRFFRLQVEMQP